MSQTTTAADEAARERPDTARVYDLKSELDACDDVARVSVDDTRTPTRLWVRLAVANVTAAVEDLLDTYHATVESDSLAVESDGTLSFEVSTPEGFKNADSREIRTHGTSVVVTLTRESLDLSGLDEGVKVDEQARDGAILLTRHED
jgi:hypothetical protein